MYRMNVVKHVVVVAAIAVAMGCQSPANVENTCGPDSEKPVQFNETNSRLIDWEDLPGELKNAAVITDSLNSSALPKNQLSRKVYYVGPWGGNGGSSFSVQPPAGSSVYAIGIRSGSLIDRIYVWYRKADGTIYMGCDRGGNGGTLYLQFFAANEKITRISGRSGKYLDQLSIYTTHKSFGYGGKGGAPFYVNLPQNYQILGFDGRSGTYIDKIGFWVYTSY